MNSAATYRRISCPFCGGQIEYHSDQHGQLAICPHCGQDIELQPSEGESVRVTPILPARQRKGINAKWVAAVVVAFLRKGIKWIAAAGVAVLLVLAAIIVSRVELKPNVSEALKTMAGGLAMTVAIVGIYFLPTIIAGTRHHRNGTGIFLLNLLLGWTVLGWVGALIWAVYQEK